MERMFRRQEEIQTRQQNQDDRRADGQDEDLGLAEEAVHDL